VISVSLTDRVSRLSGPARSAALGLALAAVTAADAGRVAAAGGAWELAVAAGLVASAAALLRAKDRFVAAVVGVVVVGAAAVVSALSQIRTGDPVAAVIALLVLGGSAVRSLPARRVLVISVAGVAAIVAGPLVELAGPPGRGAAILGLFAWGGALGAGAWLRLVDERRQASLQAARRDERLGLARELHDLVAHHVTGIVVQSQAAQTVGERHPEVVAPALAAIEAAGSETLDAMRRLVGLLRDPTDSASRTPGPGDLVSLVERFAGHGPPVRLQLGEGLPAPGWPPELTATVYRVVQEALTNVSRHAPAATKVQVHLDADHDSVVVEVTDDAGPSGSRDGGGDGYGLVGMRERVEALRGHLDAGWSPAGGWRVRARLPLCREDRP